MTLVWRPGFSGLTDADAIAYVAAVEAADGQALEFGVGKAINDFIVGCKLDGTWNAIKASCILAGARTLSGALVPLVGTAPTNVGGLFVQADYNRKTGLVGDGSAKYLDSNRNNNTDPQNSFHQSAYASSAPTSAASRFPIFIGAGDTESGTSSIGRLQNNGQLFARSQNGTAQIDLASGSSTGFIAQSRNNSSSYLFRASGNSSAITASSQAPLSRNVFVFNTSALISGSVAPGANTYSNARLAFYSIGESLDLALLDTRVSALITAIGAAIP